ncbi:MAG: alpha-E domain-containing protein [Hyphomicrobiales bacterium]|nr:alpha-E domain-containing protein [Hyphomicrobiales bacterium]MCP5370973.1 alpha-E domain-containing protein [Hyphomicrobiales bacterium]
MTNSLLARFAENIFWLARYMERAENLARIIDIAETHARDEAGGQDWKAVLEMNSDVKRFTEMHGEIAPGNVIYFYLLNRDNPNSIVSSVTYARENARSLRHLISTEMWSHLNVFQTWLTGLRRRDVTAKKLAGICGRIKQECQAHTGITEGTLYQDQGACFYWIGKSVERLDQATRLIDIGYRQSLLLGPDRDKDSHWNALLRFASGYQAYRRTHRVNMRPAEVVRFLAFDGNFPRSLLTSVETAQRHVRRLEDGFGIESGREALGILDEIRSRFLETDIQAVLDTDLHGYLDEIQRRLQDCTVALGKRCFGHLE